MARSLILRIYGVYLSLPLRGSCRTQVRLREFFVDFITLLLPQSFCFAKCQPPLRWGGSCSFQLCIIPTNSDLFNIKKIKKLLFSGAFLSDFLNRSFNYFQITFYVSFARACAYKYAVALFKNKAFVFAFNFAMTVGYYY